MIVNSRMYATMDDELNLELEKENMQSTVKDEPVSVPEASVSEAAIPEASVAGKLI